MRASDDVDASGLVGRRAAAARHSAWRARVCRAFATPTRPSDPSWHAGVYVIPSGSVMADVGTRPMPPISNWQVLLSLEKLPAVNVHVKLPRDMASGETRRTILGPIREPESSEAAAEGEGFGRLAPRGGRMLACGVLFASLCLSAVGCGAYQNAAAAAPTPTRAAAPATPACTNAAPEAQPSPSDPVAFYFIAATKEANAGLRQVEAKRNSATTVKQKKDLDRAQIQVLHQLQLRLWAIQFPPQLHDQVSQLLRSIAAEQTAYIHAAGDPNPDSPDHRTHIDNSTQQTQAASNQLRSSLALPQTKQCT